MPYWDTSCLLKLFVAEKDSPVFKQFQHASDLTVTSELTRLEFFNALQRKQLIGDVHAGGAAQAMFQFDRSVKVGRIIVEPFDTVFVSRFEFIVGRCYSQSPPILIRTADAIHVASAVSSGETTMVATDNRLRDAAGLAGLAVFP